jgi:hypothetical protein
LYDETLNIQILIYIWTTELNNLCRVIFVAVLASLTVTISAIGANSVIAQNMTDMSTTNTTGTNDTSGIGTNESGAPYSG